ncbi:PREDICTED: uncharacterized protein LOC108973763 isoform X2 [Bactrocera latifrons]|nr:PREDICTED: uncharacterized protein LOC108973763 isoform X2 [Bactrocera latifrons]
MMKHKGSSYCCRWFTLFLLAMGIVLVSPDIHTNFAEHNKQTTTKGTTAIITKTTITSTTTTTMAKANTLRTMKMLEAKGFIDANRYNVNDKNNNNNNNNLNNYHSNMVIANSNRNSKNSDKTYISAPSKPELWHQQLQQLADRAAPAEKVEPEPELEQELKEHMVSTPQSMTIMVENPTTSPAAAVARTTTTIKPKTTTIINPTTIATKTLSVSTATTLAASKPTTPTITIATSAITTRHSGSTIKLPPDNMANINVRGINAKGTMIYKQLLQRQHKQQKQQQQKQQQYWQHEKQHQQQQSQRKQTLAVVAGNRSAKQPQKYIGHTLMGDSGSTQASAAMIVATPVGRGGELANVTATAQTQIAINGKSSSNSNSNSNNNNNRNRSGIVDGITTPITATTTTTTRITLVDTFIITPTPTTTKTLTTQSKQFESARILYDYKATDANDATDEWKHTSETDAQMIVAGHEEMEVVRQYQHKFSSSYLDAAGNKDHAAAANYGNTHSFAALVQMSAKQQQQQQKQQRNRWVRQAEEEPIDKCRKFNEGDAAKNEFYSPDYPNDYPKNISCTRVIIAPPGQIIRLDFRNSFHIEAKEECKFDVLEIRDGQYGFSNLLGKFCGTDFPPEITSKERYLWLHFQSDESIEYSGFTAVYEFMDRSKEAPTTDLNCTIEKSGFEDFVNSTDVPEEIRDTAIKNRVPLDCIWRIQVQENWKIQMKFVDFRLVKPNDCEANFLDIFPEQTIMPLRKKNFCGSAGEGITSDSNTLNIRFFAEPAAINSTFSILFTAFRDKGSGTCTDEEYDCEDATCIDRKLKCNLRDNCKFRWDEEGCNKETSEVSEHIYIIMVVFGLILGGMILTFLVNCVRKIMHDQKIIREIPLPHASDIYHIDSFIWDAPKTAIFVGLQNDYMSEHNWQLHQQQHQQQQQQQAYMLQQAIQAQPHPHGSQQQLDDNGNCNGQRQNPSQSQSQSQSNGDGSTSGGSGSGIGSGIGSGSAFNSHYSNQRGGGGGGVGAYVGCHTTSKQDGNDNLYIHGLNCDNANGSCSACTYQPNVVNFNDDEFVIVTNRNGREYPLGGGCGAGAYPPELLTNSYGYDVTPVSTDSITSSKSSPTTATN